MMKAKIIAEASETNILRERIFLAKMHSPFIVNMLCSFQNKYNLFLVMELLTGGDLRYHLLNYNFFFTETQLKFLLSNLILGVEYIHKKGIAHRDIKPENAILDSKGYLKITDFGISCEIQKLDRKDDSGTPAYMAPETLKGHDQGYSVDYYSIGVLGYEIMKGNVPYDSNDRTQVRKMMKHHVINLTQEEKLKTTYSDFCLDFINKLLKKDPDERLGGKKGEKEIKEHPFFTGIDWEMIQKMNYQSPVYDIIKYSKMKHGYVKELFDFEYCNQSDDLTPEIAKLYINITKNVDFKLYFRYYTCICVENIMRELRNDEERKRRNRRRMKRSQSMNGFNPFFGYPNDIRPEYPNYGLPNIIKPTDIYHRNRELKLRNFYENKLFKYHQYLSRLDFDYQLGKAHLQQLSNPLNNNQLTLPLINNYGFFPNYNNNENPNFLPKIEPNKNMKKMMSNFYDKMNKDKDNFFVKNNRNSMFKKNHYYKNEYDGEDYLGDPLYEQDQFNNPPLYQNDPYFPNVNNNYYYNPQYYEQSMKEMQRMKNKSIKRNKERYTTSRSSKILINEETKTKKSKGGDK